MEYLWVGIGGCLGANARYALGTLIISRVGSAFPWHTLVINLTGGFLIGVILTLLTERIVVDPAWRLLLVVGFLGGYTTFSSYTYEGLALLEEGQWLSAAVYLVGSSGLGLLATILGVAAGRALGR